jgi:hypothetical protein
VVILFVSYSNISLNNKLIKELKHIEIKQIIINKIHYWDKAISLFFGGPRFHLPPRSASGVTPPKPPGSILAGGQARERDRNDAKQGQCR